MTIGEILERLTAQGRHELYALATPAQVADTEAAIGRALPDSFKAFVSEFSNGAYLFGVQEVSAVGEGNRQIAAIQNIVPLNPVDPNETVFIREGGEVRYRDLIPFGLDHNGNEWCFIAEGAPQGNEYAVAYYEQSQKKLYGRLSSFTEWLERLLQHKDEVIRTLYDDSVIDGELGLG